jgi:hypothetical protein
MGSSWQLGQIDATGGGGYKVQADQGTETTLPLIWTIKPLWGINQMGT